jgi:phosphonate transport system ATP-binding protein
LPESFAFDLKGISVAYGDTPVLRNLSLRIRLGEKVVIIGPSGAGKSTLLRHLYGLQSRRAAFIHQDYALVQQLSAFHNVCIGRLDHNGTFNNLLNLVKPQKKELERVVPILEALGMGDKIFAPVSTLSGGQQQRVAVGRALYRGGDILLGDEPVSSIDSHQANAVLRLVKQSAATVVLSLHDVGLALDLFDRIVGLRAGTVVIDLPGDQIDQEMLSDLYRPC